MSVACVLLAAGLSTRFGGDKLLAPLNGIPLGEYALRLHARLPYTEKVLVTVPGRAALIAAAERLGFTVVLNPAPEEGISSSIRLGLGALLTVAKTDGVLFGVCDQPYLTEETVNSLIAAFEKAPGHIVAPVCRGERGNPVLFPAALIAELNALTGDTGGGAVIRQHRELLITLPVTDARELHDIDRPADTRPVTTSTSEVIIP